MKIIILAAGRGTRLAPITNEAPKALVSVSDKAILAWVLSGLPPKSEVIIVRGYLGEQIVEFCQKGDWGHQLTFVENNKLRGTWDSLLSVKNHIEPGEKFLVIQGDSIHKRKHLQKLLEMDRAYGAQENDNIQYSVSPDDRGNVTGLHHIPPETTGVTRLETTGAYVLDSSAFDFEPVTTKGGETGIPQTLLAASDDYPIPLFIEDGCISIDTENGIKEAEKILNSSDEY